MLLNRNKAFQLIEILNKSIKNPKTSLKYRNRFTLLTSVVLSAQCTDVNVNNVTKNIYKKYYTPKHFVNLGITKIRNLIKSIGLFNNKAKNIYFLSKILIPIGIQAELFAKFSRRSTVFARSEVTKIRHVLVLLDLSSFNIFDIQASSPIVIF